MAELLGRGQEQDLEIVLQAVDPEVMARGLGHADLVVSASRSDAPST